MSFDLTDQQKDILTAFSEGKNLRINAFAGTGKTTILRLLVENNPKKKFLVLVFNKSVKDELKKKFPKNAEIFTINSYAYNKIKHWNGDMAVVDEKNIILKIKKYFNVPYSKAKIITDVFSKYCDSDIVKISGRTMKQLIEKDALMTHYFMIHKKTLSYDYVADKVNKIFNQMLVGTMPFTHGGYLKYFQILFEKFFCEGITYDAVMLDEGQDTNLVSLDIFKKFKGQKVIVGDTHQGIYGRRGAINAMEDVDFDSFYITKSFRISKDTAEKGSNILKNYKSEIRPLEAFYDEGGEKQGKKCTIFRTNAGIIHYLYSMFNAGQDFQFRCTRNLSEIYGGALDFEKLYNYYETGDEKYLRRIVQGRILYLKEIARDWKELGKILEEKIDDYDLSANYALVGTISKWFYLSGSEALLSDLHDWEDKKGIGGDFNLISFMYEKSMGAYDESSEHTLSTAHSVKGLEFDDVVIDDDFPSIYSKICEKFVYNKKWAMSVCTDKDFYYKINDTLTAVEDLFYDESKNINSVEMRAIIEEVNLMYVAITRAIKNLSILSSGINELLEIPKEEFRKHLMFKSIALAFRSIFVCKSLMKTDFQTYFTLNSMRYKFGSAYIFNTFKTSVNGKKRRRTRKKDNWLVITYRYVDPLFDSNVKIKMDKINLMIESDGMMYKARTKLTKPRDASFYMGENEKFCAWCFDIKKNVLEDGKLIIRNSKKDGIVVELSQLNIIEGDSLET